jgi:molybdopterin-guanine dinucleotide biosynthesis protein A
VTTGAVLCGGRSRRMGTDKALVDVDGVAMAERVARALTAGGCSPVVFVGGDPSLNRFGRPVVVDRWPGEGPLGGVLTALADAAGADVVAAACDLPSLDGPTVGTLIAATNPEVDVVVATTDRLEPGLACWSSAARPRIEQFWALGVRALHDVITELRSVEVAVDPAVLRNVNEPSDLPREPGY